MSRENEAGLSSSVLEELIWGDAWESMPYEAPTTDKVPRHLLLHDDTVRLCLLWLYVLACGNLSKPIGDNHWSCVHLGELNNGPQDLGQTQDTWYYLKGCLWRARVLDHGPDYRTDVDLVHLRRLLFNPRKLFAEGR